MSMDKTEIDKISIDKISIDKTSIEKTSIVEKDRFARFIGIKLIKAEDGYAEARMDVAENHLNGVGTVQGGAIFTLADFTFAAASNSEGFMTLAINVTISFIKPPKGKILYAAAQKIAAGRKICNYNIDVLDENKEIIARVLATGYMKAKT